MSIAMNMRNCIKRYNLEEHAIYKVSKSYEFNIEEIHQTIVMTMKYKEWISKRFI